MQTAHAPSRRERRPSDAADTNKRRGFAGLGVLLWLAAPALADPLDDKAAHFRRDLVEHHLSSEGLVLYRLDTQGPRYGNLADGPTFNGQLAAGACVRARSSSGQARARALDLASRALAGLEFLTQVTGVQGLLARSARPGPADSVVERDRKWFDGAKGFERYRWRGDASADQYANGLIPAAFECRSLFPERVRTLVTDFATHLLRHDLQIVDADGERTRFGDLSPSSAAGFNSIYQLTAYAAFALAHELDRDPRWGRKLRELRDVYRVPARSRRSNVRIASFTNHSNDLMAFNLYRALLPLARAQGDSALADHRHGLYRVWLRVKEDHNPYFALIFCRLEPTSCDPQSLVRARDTLSRFPLAKAAVTPNPVALRATPRRWLPGRKWKRLARERVPIGLRTPSSFEWKSSPYRLRVSDRATTRYSGVDYLVAYWLYEAAR